MNERKKRDAAFSTSKRDFLKKIVLLGVYIGPAIKTFEMAEIMGKPTGPIKKKEESTTGEVRLPRSPAGSTVA